MQKELLLRDQWIQEKQRLRFAGIYKITNKFTGEFYIGASQDIFARWNAHLSLIRSGKHSSERMNEGLRESGFTHPLDVFEIEILEKTTDLKIREVTYISLLQPSLNKSKTQTLCTNRPESFTEKIELQITPSMMAELKEIEDWREFVRGAIATAMEQRKKANEAKAKV